MSELKAAASALSASLAVVQADFDTFQARLIERVPSLYGADDLDRFRAGVVAMRSDIADITGYFLSDIGRVKDVADRAAAIDDAIDAILDPVEQEPLPIDEPVEQPIQEPALEPQAPASEPQAVPEPVSQPAEPLTPEPEPVPEATTTDAPTPGTTEAPIPPATEQG